MDLLGGEARYRAIVDTAVDAIVVIDEVGDIISFNPAAERLFGYQAAEVLGGNVKQLMPEPYHGAHDGFLSRYRQTGERRIIGVGREVSGRRKDGSTFPLELSVAEWSSEEGRFFTGMMRDVTERKRAEEHQRLLVNELNHRVKNTLATVQAVAGQTLRSAGSVEAARAALTSRLLAMAQAHDVLTRENWDGAVLMDVVVAALTPHGVTERFEIKGPPVRLSPKSSLALSMALHELLTNAVKYGALSNAAGRVKCCWGMAGPRRLHLTWTEQGGPPVSAPTRKGFGTRLIEAGLARELNGSARMDYRASGLVCTIVAELYAQPDDTPAALAG